MKNSSSPSKKQGIRDARHIMNMALNTRKSNMQSQSVTVSYLAHYDPLLQGILISMGNTVLQKYYFMKFIIFPIFCFSILHLHLNNEII